MQWITAARAGFFREFERVLVLGTPARAFVRKLRRSGGPEAAKFEPAPDAGPEVLMGLTVARDGREPVIVGFGNIVGPGESLVRYWAEQGVALDH